MLFVVSLLDIYYNLQKIKQDKPKEQKPLSIQNSQTYYLVEHIQFLHN